MSRTLGALAAVLGALTCGASGAAAQEPDCAGVPYPPPSGQRVQVGPSAVYAANAAALQITYDGGGPIVEGSARFDVDGPGGPSMLAADRDVFAAYTPPVPGRYTVSAHWRQYSCADGDRSTYLDVTTPVVAFEALAGRRPTVSVRTSRRPRAPNAPGDATLLAFLNCPAPSQASSDDVTLTVYYERGARRPTHASPHLRVTVRGGCDGRHDARPRSHRGRGFFLYVNRDQIQATATAPTRLRVLMEIRSAGRLLGRAYGSFSRSATGETVRRA